jgi:2-haloacid dehalogenase
MDFRRFTVLTFDCFGTLIDWETGILAALKPILKARGLKLPDQALLALYGQLESQIEAEPYRPYREVLCEVVRRMARRLGFMASRDEAESLPGSLGAWPPFPDSASALTRLGRRFDLAVVSNVDDDLFARAAPKLGVRLHAVVTAEQARSYKPSLAMFRLALDRLARPVPEILHVAQSLYHDIAPARDLGLTTVWVNRRGKKRGPGASPPSEARPDLEVPDLATLARLAARA